ncbi:MAG: relaxase/mobilization nuclease domain-containing protein, partial [Oscillospiraceae bacterium]|nr:relaxase/mobilization nuclease domain-containing protein [Oscillospiraceae bacterium]
MYNSEKFNKCNVSKKSGKKNILIHAYTQSFDKSVSPETAHAVGVEWAKRIFGENRPVIVSTHVNTDCVHNHIAVCPYDLYGNRWHSNRQTLKLARNISDEICREYGLGIIENPKRKNSLSYKEWDSRKKNVSWKMKMADVIDRLIIENDVYDISSLIEKMKERGYIFTNENRLIAKPQNVKYGCCISKLGYGYSLEMLEQRINNKQYEFIGRKISAFIGFQVEMAVGIRERQLDVYRSQNDERLSYYQVKRSADLLCYVYSNHIHSVDDMKAVIAEKQERADNLRKKYSTLENKEKLIEALKNHGKDYAALLKIKNRTSEQQRELQRLYMKFMHCGFFINSVDLSNPNWLDDLEKKLRSELKGKNRIGAELQKVNKELYQAQVNLADLKNFLETDYDRIRNRETLRRQIENYHNGLEPQADGTYAAEPIPTAARNAELRYIERVREEQRRRAELERQAERAKSRNMRGWSR